MRFLLIVLLVTSFAACKPDRFNKTQLPSEYIYNNFDAAKQESDAKKRPILIVFYAKWCSLCTDMKEKTFKDQAVIDELTNKFVVVFLDTEENPGIEVAKTYDTKHLNQAILNLDYTLKAKRAGKVPTDVFMEWARQYQ